MGTALVIDDNSMNLATLGVLLKKEGMTAIELSNPSNLPAQIDGINDIQVVFLDLEFPNYTGLELLNDFRTLPQLAGVPIIAYSVHISELNEVRDAGFDGFLGKPLDVHHFPEQLQAILNGESIWEVGQ